MTEAAQPEHDAKTLSLSSTNDYQYVVSAQKPTGVSHSCVGAFTGPNDLNLVVAKTSRLEVHNITSQGLQPVFDVGIYARISSMQLFRSKGHSTDLLLILTERHQFCILSFDAKSKELVTEARGDLRDRIGRPVDRGNIMSVDPDNKVIGMYMYEFLYKIVPIHNGFKDKAFNVRLEERHVLDIVFLHNQTRPTIAVLYVDAFEARHLSTYVVDTNLKTLQPGSWSRPDVHPSACMLIPIPQPLGGVIILGTECITYFNGSALHETKSIPPMAPRAFGKIDEDGSRWLIGDYTGSLYILGLDVTGHSSSAVETSSTPQVTNISFERLGEISIPSTLSYLDRGFVFVGSCFGDSQLIRLSSEPVAETQSYIQICENYTSLGPIVDMCVMNIDQGGESQIVTCSGAHKDGSLRIVRSGIGIDQQAVVELPGIKGIWSLRNFFNARHDKWLIQAFATETRVFAIEGDNMDETNIDGFDLTQQTLFASNMLSDTLLQVTPTAVLLASASKLSRHSCWQAPAGHRITLADASGTQVLLALTGGKVVLLELDESNTKLVEASSRQMENEVSCLSINPLTSHAFRQAAGLIPIESAEEDTQMSNTNEFDTDANAGERATHSLMAAIGLWTDVSVQLVTLPKLEMLVHEALGGQIQSHSVALVTLEETDYLVVALADGHVNTYHIGTTLTQSSTGNAIVSVAELSHKRHLVLGSQPIQLSLFSTNGGGIATTHLFAACDRPTVLYSAGKKLLLTNVNMNNVSHMCPFDAEAFPDCLALATDNDLTIGTVDDIQKLHIRSLPLGEQPRRISHAQHSKVLCVVTLAVDESSQIDMEKGYLRIFDESTFENIDNYELDAYEQPQAITTGFLDVEQYSTESSASQTATATATLASRSNGGSALTEKHAQDEYIVVTTAYLLDGEEEPSSGRILVFSLIPHENTKRLHLVAQQHVSGGALAAMMFEGRLVVGINSRVCIYRWECITAGSNVGTSANTAENAASATESSTTFGNPTDLSGGPTGEYELVADTTFHGNVLVLYLAKCGNYIATGDLMKSVALLNYRKEEGLLVEVARDPASMWTTGIEMLDGETLVAADSDMHLTTFKRDMGTGKSDASHRLNIKGQFHVGDLINRFCKGTLVMHAINNTHSSSNEDIPMLESSNTTGLDTPDETSNDPLQNPVPQLLFGTVGGSIGVMISLPPSMYEYLRRAEIAMTKVVHGVGALRHNEWRSYYSDSSYLQGRFDADHDGFIDGDLLELFLDLDLDSQRLVVESLNNTSDTSRIDETCKHPDGKGKGPATVEELYNTIEDLSRLH